MDTQTRQRNTWTPAQDARDRGKIQPYEHTAPGVIIDPSAAWANVAPAEMAHTSGQDRARGLILKSLPVLILELVLAIALTVLGVIVLGIDAGAGPTFLTILLIWGALGLGSYLFLAERSDWYSSTGVEHHRVDSAEVIAVTQIESDTKVRMAALTGYLSAMAEIEAKRDNKQLTSGRGPLL